MSDTVSVNAEYQHINVYNISVEETHSYLVGKSDVVVHNKNTN